MEFLKETNPLDNNTLLISEKDQKAYLPYKYIDIERIYNESEKYLSNQDVIQQLYVKPLNNFSNSVTSRFREGFNLVRYKENGSISSALNVALELMFNYRLNPIIIAACKSIDELDIYIDCLDSDELYDFDCFKIVFEVAPEISKNQREEYYY